VLAACRRIAAALAHPTPPPHPTPPGHKPALTRRWGEHPPTTAAQGTQAPPGEHRGRGRGTRRRARARVAAPARRRARVGGARGRVNAPRAVLNGISCSLLASAPCKSPARRRNRAVSSSRASPARLGASGGGRKRSNGSSTRFAPHQTPDGGRTARVEPGESGPRGESPAAAMPRPKTAPMAAVALLMLFAYRSGAAADSPAAGGTGAGAPLRARAPPPAPRLPWAPASWRYARGGEATPPDDAGRFWDRPLLRRSLGATNYAQMRRLLEKLNAGQPITVAAVGSSVVQVRARAPPPRRRRGATCLAPAAQLLARGGTRGWPGPARAALPPPRAAARRALPCPARAPPPPGPATGPRRHVSLFPRRSARRGRVAAPLPVWPPWGRWRPSVGADRVADLLYAGGQRDVAAPRPPAGQRGCADGWRRLLRPGSGRAGSGRGRPRLPVPWRPIAAL
jgi:hypothetical protein